jgi:hypothetical protein
VGVLKLVHNLCEKAPFVHISGLYKMGTALGRLHSILKAGARPRPRQEGRCK